MCGESSKVCEKWMQPITTKVLINTHWRLNQFIDNNMSKPTNVHSHHWRTLVAMRTTKVLQAKYENMRSISKWKGSTTMHMKTIDREVVTRLVSLWNYVSLMCDLYLNYIWSCVCRLIYVLTFVMDDFGDNIEEPPTIRCRNECGSRQRVSTLTKREMQGEIGPWNRIKVYLYSSLWVEI